MPERTQPDTLERIITVQRLPARNDDVAECERPLVFRVHINAADRLRPRTSADEAKGVADSHVECFAERVVHRTLAQPFPHTPTCYRRMQRAEGGAASGGICELVGDAG